ncbi:GNAT family N-acetyltransferase [Pedobacter sp. JCM 36344]|uniref:GNAT family N-acetyltransferase n=1 Tax=Pedobacter sp. JCM 36344 TaxID=3374280 RepID=UPI00397C188A
MIILRKAKEEDVEVIQHIANNTWYDTYGSILTLKQIEYMLDKMYNKGMLLSQLQEGHTFLIASENQNDIGFMSFSLTDADKNVYKLHKLYVLPSAHGKGLGKLLMNEVYSIAKNEGGVSLELNVNRSNKAVDFYKHAGFQIKETVDLDIGGGFFMNDYVMEKAI